MYLRIATPMMQFFYPDNPTCEAVSEYSMRDSWVLHIYA